MFKKMLGVALISLTVSAWGYRWFPINPLIQITPYQLTAQVYNPYYEPIACRGQVFGINQFGQNMTAFFNDPFIPGGQVRYAFLRATPFQPFVRGWANIHCHFLRY